MERSRVTVTVCSLVGIVATFMVWSISPRTVTRGVHGIEGLADIALFVLAAVIAMTGEREAKPTLWEGVCISIIGLLVVGLTIANGIEGVGQPAVGRAVTLWMGMGVVLHWVARKRAVAPGAKTWLPGRMSARGARRPSANSSDTETAMVTK